MSPIRWLWNDMGKKRVRLIIGLILTAISAGTVIINPMLAQRLIDDVITPGNTALLPRLLITMMVVQIVRLSLRYLMVVIMELHSTDVITDIRRRMYDIVQNQDYHFLGQFRTGNLMTRMTSDLEMIRHSLAWISYQFVDAVVLFASTLIFLLFINWQLALSLAVITPFILFLSRQYIKRFRPRTMLLREKLTQLSTKVTENIEGNRVVKAFAREDYEKQQFEKHNADYRDTSYENALISAQYQPVLEFFSQVLSVITLMIGGIFLIKGTMTAGQYLSFSSLTWALSNPLRMLGMLLADLQRFHAAAAMIIEVLESKASIVDCPDPIKLIRPAGRIEFRHVNLAINGNHILKDISFKAEPGQTIGILGSTGAGKTALVNMLIRFYEPSSGEVFLDGVNVNRYTLSSLRRRIGLAMQEIFLFSDSIAGNIAYGRTDLDRDSVKLRALQADAAHFIQSMENGYDTLVGERGVGLSGGQRQRISLARALAIKPAVLVLDDTTSSVDSETEHYIQEQLQNLDFPCTKIIIAGRISSFRGADLILVMDNGRIVERGSHEQLLANKGFYYHIWTLQYAER
ncbi:MAG: ABC transporter ATP-binding protein/permease [Spirochaetaceae bacterium]|jgi:ATP-binding cassette subfamily B protein|nr:ABC transporter ATP-binding protein/permease [Spirochaetaceae bacterium]